jgi:hypothetical protein
MFLVFGKAFLEESHRRYYVKIGAKTFFMEVDESQWKILNTP